MFRLRMSALVVVGVLTMAGSGFGVESPMSTSIQLASADDITLRVLTIDGAAAAGIEGRLTILDGLVKGEGRHTAVVHPVRTDATGGTVVEFPHDDPYVVAHPAQDHFNVEVNFVAETAPGLVASAMVRFVYDRRANREATVVPVSGSVLRLSAPRTAPTMPDPTPIECISYHPDSPSYVCADTTYPQSMRQNPTVFATNAGAGRDTLLNITYEEAGRVETTTVTEQGFGPVEVTGSVRIDNEDETTLEFGGGDLEYGSPNETAVVLTSWVRYQLYYCEHPFYPNTDYRSCERESQNWLPHAVVTGAQIASRAVWHDRYCSPTSVPFDCTNAQGTCLTPISLRWSRGTGEQRLRIYDAKLEFEGSVRDITLHASAKYVRSEEESKVSTHTYTPISPALYSHFLFTQTDLPYDQAVPGGAVCPETNIGDTWTYAQSTSVIPDVLEFAQNEAAAADARAQSETGTDPNSRNGVKTAGRCAHYPEDCRPDSR